MSATNGSGQEQQKVVLVTGASSGIGEAITAALAQRGWRVFGASSSGTAIAAFRRRNDRARRRR